MFRLMLILLLSLSLMGCQQKESNEKWVESPLFSSEGVSMIGQDGRLGFIYDDSEVTRFYPGKVQKYMWHFWGKKEEFNGELKVIATHEGSKEQIKVVEFPLGGSNNGADQHVPSHMSLPESGMWKLDAFIGEKLFGSVFVKVH